MAKQYGLILKGKANVAAKPKLLETRLRPNIFGDSDDDKEGEKSGAPPKKDTTNITRVKKQVQLDIQKALAEDPNVFEYDEVYDAMEKKKAEEKPAAKLEKERKPKYISNLLKMADHRKKEYERRVEKQVQKDREAEGEEFADKESFVTSAYRKKMEEQAEAEAKEKHREMLESRMDVTNQKDLSWFYRHFLKQTVGEEAVPGTDSPIKLESDEKQAAKEIKKEPEDEEDGKRSYRQRREHSSDRTQRREHSSDREKPGSRDEQCHHDSHSDDSDSGRNTRKDDRQGRNRRERKSRSPDHHRHDKSGARPKMSHDERRGSGDFDKSRNRSADRYSSRARDHKNLHRSSDHHHHRSEKRNDEREHIKRSSRDRSQSPAHISKSKEETAESSKLLNRMERTVASRPNVTPQSENDTSQNHPTNASNIDDDKDAQKSANLPADFFDDQNLDADSDLDIDSSDSDHEPDRSTDKLGNPDTASKGAITANSNEEESATDKSSAGNRRVAVADDAQVPSKFARRNDSEAVAEARARYLARKADRQSCRSVLVEKED